MGKVVLHRNDRAELLPAIVWPAKASPHHLLVQVQTEGQAGDEDDIRLQGTDDCSKDAVVYQDRNRAVMERSDEVSTHSTRRGTVNDAHSSGPQRDLCAQAPGMRYRDAEQ